MTASMDFDTGYAFEPSAALDGLVTRATALADSIVDDLRTEAPELFGPDADRISLRDDRRLVPQVFELRTIARQRARKEGLYGAALPRDVGGGGVGCLAMCVLEEALTNRPPYPSVLWPDLTIHLLGRAWGPTPVLLKGSDHIRERYFAPLMTAEQTTCIALTDPDAGSDPQNMRATAVRRGDAWVVNGRKRFVGNSPYADFLMVYARTSGEPGSAKGISMFVVDRDTPGFRVDHVNPVLEGIGNHGELVFEDCAVPAENLVGEEGRGFYLAMDYVGAARLSIAARCLGGAQWLLDQAVARARDRHTFGQPLADRQAIQWLLADLATDIEQLRWLVRRAGAMVDAGGGRRETAMAKLRAPHVYHRAADVAMQVHGGLGYLADLPIERAYRRARGYRFIEGTDEMQRQTIARDLVRSAP